MKRRSRTINLLELTLFVIKGIKMHIQTEVIYNNFGKAFDSVNHVLLVRKLDLSVNHVLLVRKLDLLGFPVDPLIWILSYLNCRTQRVPLKSSLPRYLR